MDDLRYDDPMGHDNIYNIDDSDDIYLMADFPVSQSAQSHSAQCGYQDRRALKGTSRGHRSESFIIVVDCPLGKPNSKKLEETSENGKPHVRMPPCGHTEAKILTP